MDRKMHPTRNPSCPLQTIRRKIKRSWKQNRYVIFWIGKIEQLIEPKNERIRWMETQSPKRRTKHRIFDHLNQLFDQRKRRPQKLHCRQIKRIRWLKIWIQQIIGQLLTSLIQNYRIGKQIGTFDPRNRKIKQRNQRKLTRNRKLKSRKQKNFGRTLIMESQRSPHHWIRKQNRLIGTRNRKLKKPNRQQIQRMWRLER